MPSRQDRAETPQSPKYPTLEPERALARLHGELSAVAGLDEAGRGALAGPVFAAAVVLPLAENPRLAALSGVNDSKQLTPATRERLFPLICESALGYGVGQASADEIDTYGIVPATRIAMMRALEALSPQAEALLIDGTLRLETLLPQWSLIRGDGLSLSIAAASVLAKVSRDRIMVALDSYYPDYGFAAHKGYGTDRHLRALAKAGPCREHRLTFAPLNRRGQDD